MRFFALCQSFVKANKQKAAACHSVSKQRVGSSRSPRARHLIEKSRRIALRLCLLLQKTRRSYKLRTTGERCNYHLISTYSGHFNCSTFNSRSFRSRWGSFERNLRVQSQVQSWRNSAFFELAAAVPNLFVVITSGPRCERVRSKLLGNFLFADIRPRSAIELCCPQQKGSGRIAQIQRAEVSPVPKVKQLTVSCDNTPGSPGRASRVSSPARR